MIPLPDIKISAYGENNKNNNIEGEDDSHVNETDQLLLDESHLSVPPTYPSESVGRGKSYLSPLLSSPELKRFISSPLIQFNNPKEHRDVSSDSDEMELLTNYANANEADSDEEAEVNAIFMHQQQRQPQHHTQQQQPQQQQHPQQTQQCTQKDLPTRSIKRNNTVRENRYSLAAAAENFTLAKIENEHRISALKQRQESKPLRLVRSCIRKIVGKDKVFNNLLNFS